MCYVHLTFCFEYDRLPILNGSLYERNKITLTYPKGDVGNSVFSAPSHYVYAV